jgi:hypothetical protein
MPNLRNFLRSRKHLVLSWLLERQLPKDKPLQDRLHAGLMDELLKNNPNYDLNKVPLGFANRRDTSIDDKETIHRICSAYKKAKQMQKTLGPEFRESNEWSPIYNAYMQPIMTALMNEDIAVVRQTYQNFWRDPCSTGLVGLPVDMASKFFGSTIVEEDAKLALRDFLWFFRLWRELVPDADVSSLQSPNIGNPYGYFINDVFLRSGSDYHHFYATQILRLLPSLNHNVVGEIGGGFGGMAYYLIRDAKKLTYIDFDLPENMALTAYYLLSAFPKKRIGLYGEIDLSLNDLQTYDAIILPSFAIKTLPPAAIDLMFNSYSLAEMSKETIAMFVNEFSRIVRSQVLHVNHNHNSLVKADDFGIDGVGFSLVYKTPALWGYARNRDSDEFEYLYRRDDQANS